MPFYHLPNPWNPGYAIPKYVLAEPPGRGTFTTKWLPRGTISQVAPDYLAKPVDRKLTGRDDVELGSLAGDSLGAMQIYDLEPLGQTTRATGTIDVSKPGFTGDPIKAYGERASEWIMGTIDEVDPDDRIIALRALLDGIDKSLWQTVEKRATKYKGKGMPVKRALQKALAVSMSNGVAAELLAAGKKHLAGQGAGIPKRSLLGLGLYDDAVGLAYYEALDVMGQLGLSWGDLNPAKHVKNAGKAVGKAIGKAGKWTGGTVWSGAKAVGRGAQWTGGKVWDGTKWVGGKVKSGTMTAVKWVGNGLEKLGGLGCAVANSPVAPAAAAAAATSQGAPPQTGMAGVGVARALCNAKGAAPGAAQSDLYAPVSRPLPGWVLPAGIGAVGLIAVMALRK